MKSTRLVSTLMLAAAAMVVGLPADGQTPAASAPAGPTWPERVLGAPVAISIAPRSVEKPELTYALLPKMEDVAKGNAAPKYLAALAQLPDLKPEESATINAASGAMPLAALNVQNPELIRLVAQFSTPLRFLEQGARLESADWETNVRQSGVATLLPWLGKTRNLARVLAVRIRMEIKRHDWTAARDDLQTGYMLARHMGQGETLIESLVGIAIATTMNRCVEDWIAQTDSPNLYWPLANLPSPFNDLRRPLSYERGMIYASLPEMKEMRDGHFSAEAWNRMWSQFADISRDTGVTILPQPLEGNARWLYGPAMGLAMYPQAKSFLIERGLSREDVEKMPVAEALGRYFVRSYDESEDDFFKWKGLSWSEELKGMRQSEKLMQNDSAVGNMNILSRLLQPSMNRPVFLAAQLDRQTDMLRIAEALRAHAAAKGDLPENLAQVNLPIPMDPITGKPFDYQRQGNKATLSSPKSDYGEGAILEITLSK